MTLTAKYPSRCGICGKQITIGQRIEWSKQTGAYCAHHAAKVVDGTLAAPSAPRPPTRRVDNGWCNRCQSHCYGDCTASNNY